MKIFVIKSSHSEVPLAEIRTDGRVLDFVVDNTNGKLPRLFQNNYETMIKIVSNSSHLDIEQPKQATVNLLRYLMDNGDVVEITSDGHTVILNGNLLGQPEKDALFAAFRRGEIKVSRKTDIQQALPIMSGGQPVQQQMPKPKFTTGLMAKIEEDQASADRRTRLASRKYDEDIENAQLHAAEDKEWTRKLMYWLKYGDEE